MKKPYETAEELAFEKLCLATSNLQKISGCTDDDDTMNGLLCSLNQSMLDARANNPHDLCDALIIQSRILDALFHRFINQSKDLSNMDDMMEAALRSQLQMVRSLNTWKELKKETYIRHKLVKLIQKDAEDEERTEQNDDSWIPNHAPVDR